jgi:hypothetical protein
MDGWMDGWIDGWIDGISRQDRHDLRPEMENMDDHFIQLQPYVSIVEILFLQMDGPYTTS